MTESASLTEWLTQVLDDDEFAAKQASRGDWEKRERGGLVAKIVSARGAGGALTQWYLADIAAKRAIVAEHTPFRIDFDRITGCKTCSYRNDEEELQVEWPCPTLRLLASAYADRPGYREEWKP